MMLLKTSLLQLSEVLQHALWWGVDVVAKKQ